jgi:protein-S-isoprenylcysteine O-methyltransferase Ste14
LISLELKIPPLFLLAIFAVGMWSLSILFPAYQTNMPGNIGAACIFFVLGILIPAGAVISFRRARTTVDPRVPDESTELVKTGIYQFSRNPMYLGFLSLLVSWFFYLGNWAGIILLPLFVLYLTRFQIMPEERILLEHFGEPFQDYLNTVRRWI